MKLNTIDGAALMSQPLRPPDFVVDSLLSQGLHILAGSPKVGKSWLVLWLAVMVAKGEPVWDMATRQGHTLYLCLEDSVLRIQNRLFEITEDAPESVHFCTECAPPSDRDWRSRLKPSQWNTPARCWSSSTLCRWFGPSTTPPAQTTTGTCPC